MILYLICHHKIFVHDHECYQTFSLLVKELATMLMSVFNNLSCFFGMTFIIGNLFQNITEIRFDFNEMFSRL